MCKVSDKLKLCSCKTQDIRELKHYWILKRNDGGDLSVVGETMIPVNIGEKADKLNADTLCVMLNEGNCFDVEMQHRQNDILELHFTCIADRNNVLNGHWNGNFLEYEFRFRNKKWRKAHYDPFSLHLEDIQSGKIVRPFVKAKANS